jgi:hypothetical protein
MKNLTLLFCLVAVIACTDKSVDTPQVSSPQLALRGTYSVTYLTQYQDGQIVFEGSLPSVISNKVTIKHALSVDVSTSDPSQASASVGYAANQSWQNHAATYGRPVTSYQIPLKATPNPGTFDFYDNKGSFLGTSNGTTLSFDFMLLDSLSHSVRYVYKAVKVSPKPNYFTFSY